MGRLLRGYHAPPRCGLSELFRPRQFGPTLGIVDQIRTVDGSSAISFVNIVEDTSRCERLIHHLYITERTRRPLLFRVIKVFSNPFASQLNLPINKLNKLWVISAFLLQRGKRIK
jgi:hypothetical protein